jgi:hypothetical protein
VLELTDDSNTACLIIRPWILFTPSENYDVHREIWEEITGDGK